MRDDWGVGFAVSGLLIFIFATLGLAVWLIAGDVVLEGSTPLQGIIAIIGITILCQILARLHRY